MRSPTESLDIFHSYCPAGKTGPMPGYVPRPRLFLPCRDAAVQAEAMPRASERGWHRLQLQRGRPTGIASWRRARVANQTLCMR